MLITWKKSSRCILQTLLQTAVWEVLDQQGNELLLFEQWISKLVNTQKEWSDFVFSFRLPWQQHQQPEAQIILDPSPILLNTWIDWQIAMKWSNTESSFFPSYNCYFMYTVIGSYLIIIITFVLLSQGWNSSHVVQFMKMIAQMSNESSCWVCLYHPRMGC